MQHSGAQPQAWGHEVPQKVKRNITLILIKLSHKMPGLFTSFVYIVYKIYTQPILGTLQQNINIITSNKNNNHKGAN